MLRRFGRQDLLIALVDEGLRTLFAPIGARRASPAAQWPEVELGIDLQRESARLMRVNRAGEIAAQALYLGQSVTARNPVTVSHLLAAAAEERDHLAWCTERINELGGQNSRLDPLWYVGSACIGIAAGLAGDATSLGFVAETERQVEAHIEDHLGRLAPQDARSRAVLEQMSADEARHGDAASAAGAAGLAPIVRQLMAAGGSFLRQFAHRM
jgi:ubiquinone biosynthesis monooxygenase Coq7